MKTVRFLSFVALILILLIGSFAYASDLQKDILGKWKEIGRTEIQEYFEDGTVTVIEGKNYMDGEYKFLDRNRVKLRFYGIGAMLGLLVVEISISENVLTMKMPDGEIMKYRKME